MQRGQEQDGGLRSQKESNSPRSKCRKWKAESTEIERHKQGPESPEGQIRVSRWEKLLGRSLTDRRELQQQAEVRPARESKETSLRRGLSRGPPLRSKRVAPLPEAAQLQDAASPGALPPRSGPPRPAQPGHSSPGPQTRMGLRAPPPPRPPSQT